MGKKDFGCVAKRNKYMVMWSGQLGGLPCIFVKESQVKYVSNVECSFKTGLGGVSANKGGIAVSFKFSDTTICLCLLILQRLSNIEERHQNYKALMGIQFRKSTHSKP